MLVFDNVLDLNKDSTKDLMKDISDKNKDNS